jgi:hypothetical protein
MFGPRTRTGHRLSREVGGGSSVVVREVDRAHGREEGVRDSVARQGGTEGTKDPSDTPINTTTASSIFGKILMSLFPVLVANVTLVGNTSYVPTFTPTPCPHPTCATCLTDPSCSWCLFPSPRCTPSSACLGDPLTTSGLCPGAATTGAEREKVGVAVVVGVSVGVLVAVVAFMYGVVAWRRGRTGGKAQGQAEPRPGAGRPREVRPGVIRGSRMPRVKARRGGVWGWFGRLWGGRRESVFVPSSAAASRHLDLYSHAMHGQQLAVPQAGAVAAEGGGTLPSLPASFAAAASSSPALPRLPSSTVGRPLTLREMVVSDDLPALRRAIAMGLVDLEQADETGATPLYTACRLGLVEAAVLLIDAGADVNALVKHPLGLRSPLHAACEEGRVEAVALLLASGAAHNPNPRDPGPSPAELAARRGHHDVEAILASLLSRPWIVDAMRRTVTLHLAGLAQSPIPSARAESHARSLACVTRYHESHLMIVKANGLDVLTRAHRAIYAPAGVAEIDGTIVLRRAVVLCLVELCESPEPAMAQAKAQVVEAVRAVLADMEQEMAKREIDERTEFLLAQLIQDLQESLQQAK